MQVNMNLTMLQRTSGKALGPPCTAISDAHTTAITSRHSDRVIPTLRPPSRYEQQVKRRSAANCFIDPDQVSEDSSLDV